MADPVPTVVRALALLGPLLAAGVHPPAALASQASVPDARTAILQVWPAEHADAAIRLAKLESGLSSTARGCAGACIGLFQIHYTANRGFLAEMGIDSPDELLDPVVNSTVAYRLFRTSGWRPWGGPP